jgi:transcriptional regulator GlxA family with amidase domain
MRIAVLIFDGITALDAVGPAEVFRSVRGWEVRFVAPEAGEVRTESGELGLIADEAMDAVARPDVVVVPGGRGNRRLLADERVLSWLRAVHEHSRWTTSVCTGSLVLAAAGLLAGRRATCHWLYLDQLRELGADAVGGRFLEDGRQLTAAGLSPGNDMALHLVGREAGPDVAQQVQLGLEYDPQPPFDAGSPEKAPPAVVEALRSTRLTPR